MNRNNTTRKSTGDDIANVNLFATTSSITFTPCAPEATEFGEITQNNGHYAVQGHSRSPISVPIETSLYDFLLVINNNLPPILHRFRDIAIDKSTVAIFGYPSCVYPTPRTVGFPGMIFVKFSVDVIG